MAVGLGFSVDANLRRRTERVANEYRDSIPDTAVQIPEGEDTIGPRRDAERDYTRYDYENSRENFETYPESRRDTSSTLDDRRESSTYDDREISPRSSYEYEPRESRSSSRDESLRDRDVARDESSRHHDEQSYSYDRTNEETRAYERDSRTSDTRRGIEHNEPFDDVPRREDSIRTRN